MIGGTKEERCHGMMGRGGVRKITDEPREKIGMQVMDKWSGGR